MNYFSVEINNSFCKFSNNVPPDILDIVKQVLTYTNDIAAAKGMIFKKMRYFKKIGETEKYQKAIQELRTLEASEIVCWLNGLEFPTGHLNIVLDILKELKQDPIINDKRIIPSRDFNVSWVNKPWDPRYYQSDMIDLGKLHHRGVFESAVGTGKSLIIFYLIYYIPVVSLIIVPTSGLKGQIYTDLVLHFGINNVQKVTTDDVRSGRTLKNIRVMTVKSVASLQKTGDLSKLIHDVKALYIDEIHHAGSKSYTDLLPDIDHIYYRFGFTGTFLRNDSKTLDLWGFLSTKLYSYPAYKAIEEGNLTPIEVRIYKLKGKRKLNYRKEYDANYCENPILLDKVLNIIQATPQDKQILILVKRKAKSGKIIHEYLNALGYTNTYISGDNTADVINDTISNFNDKKIRILVGSSVIGEGIDICSTDHLIMAQGEKSEISIVQAVGRLARLFEGKFVGILHDFNFTGTKYMSKHIEIRKDIYRNNFAPKIIKEE